MQDHTDIIELERRITAALSRIGAGIDKLAEAPGAAEPGADTALHEAELRSKDAEIVRLRTALEAEKRRTAELESDVEKAALAAQVPGADRLRSGRDREAMTPGQLEEKVDKMTRQLDVQGLELQRMRKSTIQLREHLRVLHEAAAEGTAEPHLINKAMLAELESLRATRHTETAEMDEIIAELAPLIEEVRANG